MKIIVTNNYDYVVFKNFVGLYVCANRKGAFITEYTEANERVFKVLNAGISIECTLTLIIRQATKK